MSLLLFLSALLSALTGVAGTVRPAAPALIARAASVTQAAPRVARLGQRPAMALPHPARLAAAAAFTMMTLAAPVPLYAGRRRE